MPVARTRSVALLGLTGSVVEVEADLSSQLPGFVIIGLPDAALAEARERVRSAAVNAGCPLPQRKLTVNLSPAALPKHGSGFDLAIAIACLAAAGELSVESVDRVVHLGELGLDGRLRPIDGILPAVLAAARAGHDTVMVPTANAAEAALVPGVEVIGVASLLEAAIRHGGEYDDHPVEPVPALTRTERDRRARDRRPRRRRGQRRRRRRAPHGGGRRAPPVPARTARRGQDHARVAPSRHPARPRRGCRARGLVDPVALRASARRRAHDPPAVRGAASHGHRRGDRRRRQPGHPTGRRRARLPWRAVPRRGTRVPGRSARRAPAAAGVGHHQHPPRQRGRVVPRPIPARDRREPVSVRRLRRGGVRLHLPARDPSALPRAHLRPPARPHRPAGVGPAHHDRRAPDAPPVAGRVERGGPCAGGGGTRASRRSDCAARRGAPTPRCRARGCAEPVACIPGAGPRHPPTARSSAAASRCAGTTAC